MSNPFLEEQVVVDFTQMNAEQLREKQLELERREQQIQYQQMKIQEVQQKQGVEKPPNWPRCRPLIYHNIHDEIPENGRTIVRRVYFSWFSFSFALFLNMIALLSGVIVDSDVGVDFGISIALLAVLIPVSFVFWYRTLYVAVKRDRGVNYFFFFFNYICHIGFCIIMCIGIPKSGAGGFINAVTVFSGKNVASGIILLISASFWVLLTFFCVWQYKGVIFYYRARGHTVQGDATKIQSDATKAAANAANSPAGREAIAGAAVKAANSPAGREIVTNAAVEVAKNANSD